MSVGHLNIQRRDDWATTLKPSADCLSAAPHFGNEHDAYSHYVQQSLAVDEMAADEGPAALRAAFAANATGVAVVTALTPLGAFAMTTNRVTMLSDQPPLIGWTLPRNSVRAEAFSQAKHFAVHLLAHDQQDIALHFVRRGRIDDIQNVEYNTQNVAKLPGCLAEFECRLDAVQRFGDHLMIVGEIEAFDARQGEALLFHHERYDRTMGAKRWA